jgi:ribonuclease P protein component
VEGGSDETDISTEQSEAQTAARIPGAHGDEERPACAGPPPEPRPQADQRLRPGASVRTLKRRAEFLRVQHGPKWVSPAFILQALPQTGSTAAAVGDEPRFGFTVSSRAVAKDRDGQKRRGTAVDRNRARRRLKEVVRLVAADAARPGFDYVIIGRAPALSRNFDELLADMRAAFHKINTKASGGKRPGPR